MVSEALGMVPAPQFETPPAGKPSAPAWAAAPARFHDGVENGSPGRIRTADQSINSRLLYR
jgi:hypothetical protein